MYIESKMNQFEITLRNPDRVLTVAFGEATPEQELSCRHLAAAEWSMPLSKEDYVEQEKYLSQKPLVSNRGWRLWCLSLLDHPSEVLATCKTIPRELLIRDVSVVGRAKAYCIASVVTHPQYRGLGLASRLLEYVSAWLDGPGDAVVSVLYTSIGDFYERRGWAKLPAIQSTLSWPADFSSMKDGARLPVTNPILSTELLELCKQDVRDVEYYFEKLSVQPDEFHVSVLPTADLISWLHGRSDFIGNRIEGAPPRSHGSICGAADSWLYWYHDFRKQQLAIQRIRIPQGPSQVHREALAAMLVDAVEEACRWKLNKVILWEPNAEVLGAMQILQGKFNIKSETLARHNKSVPSLRWHMGGVKRTTFHFNEFYTWS
ncbi:hypothetical protein RRF57_013175 [Xylaria bambusicola]|uniref:N-acetyltransferase domain-containing protein n=1 Tax=Xylaria bambusicola TaxID=326684 RepID=A0AAN7Z546_9PEZI